MNVIAPPAYENIGEMVEEIKHLRELLSRRVPLTVEEYRERALTMYTEGWSDGAYKEPGIPRDFSDDWHMSDTKRRLDEEVGNGS